MTTGARVPSLHKICARHHACYTSSCEPGDRAALRVENSCNNWGGRWGQMHVPGCMFDVCPLALPNGYRRRSRTHASVRRVTNLHATIHLEIVPNIPAGIQIAVSKRLWALRFTELGHSRIGNRGRPKWQVNPNPTSGADPIRGARRGPPDWPGCTCRSIDSRIRCTA